MEANFCEPADESVCQAESILVAERLINSALLGLCQATDTYDLRSFLALCSIDAHMDFGVRYTGPAEGFFLSIVDARTVTIAMEHKIGKVKVDFSMDMLTAHSRTSVVADVTRNNGEGVQQRLVHGEYQDNWRFLDNSWLLQGRVYCQLSESRTQKRSTT